jgi:hypothetical protein
MNNSKNSNIEREIENALILIDFWFFYQFIKQKAASRIMKGFK